MRTGFYLLSLSCPSVCICGSSPHLGVPLILPYAEIHPLLGARILLLGQTVYDNQV